MDLALRGLRCSVPAWQRAGCYRTACSKASVAAPSAGLACVAARGATKQQQQQQQQQPRRRRPPSIRGPARGLRGSLRGSPNASFAHRTRARLDWTGRRATRELLPRPRQHRRGPVMLDARPRRSVRSTVARHCVRAHSATGFSVTAKDEDEDGIPVGTPIDPESAMAAIRLTDLRIETVAPPDISSIPKLCHGLDRVLFNPGVYHLQDPRSRVFNFSPYLQQILPVENFDYDALGKFVTSSEDRILDAHARAHSASIVGSTSSVTSILSHFHYLLSAWRPINADSLSSTFANLYKTYTIIQRSPTSVFLKYHNGIYSIDMDKSLDSSDNILSFLGRSMEKLFTLPIDAFNLYRKDRGMSHTVRPHGEHYRYIKMDQLLMRSQLDCHDQRLPGTGVFDIKTRAVLSVRMNVCAAKELAGYQIRSLTGLYESFEREYYDMIRSAFLKYSMQVRIGQMDGIFVAYHNTERIFGFQYINLEEMDYCIHGNARSLVGDQEFKYSLKLLERAILEATELYPKQSIRMLFETRKTSIPRMYIFAETLNGQDSTESDSNVQGKCLAGWTLQVYSYINGRSITGPPDIKPGNEWIIVPSLVRMKDEVVQIRYKASKRRRILAFEGARQQHIDDEGNPKVSYFYKDAFRQKLNDLAVKGRKYLETSKATEPREPIIFSPHSTVVVDNSRQSLSS